MIYGCGRQHPFSFEGSDYLSVEVKKLGELCEIITGVPDEKKSDNAKFSYMYIQPSCLSEFNEVSNMSQVYRQTEVKKKSIVLHNDILVKRIGPTHVNIIKNPKSNTYVSSNLLIIRAHEFNVEYIAMVLESRGLSLLTHYTKKGVTVQTVSKKELGQIDIPIISKEKQLALGNLWNDNKLKLRLLNKLIDQEKKIMKSALLKVIDMEEEV